MTSKPGAATIQLVNFSRFNEYVVQNSIGSAALSDFVFICTVTGNVRIREKQDVCIANHQTIYLLNAKEIKNVVLEDDADVLVVFLSECFFFELQMTNEFPILSEQFLTAQTPLSIHVDGFFKEEIWKIIGKMVNLISAQPRNFDYLLRSLFKIFLIYISVNCKEIHDEVFVTRNAEITDRFFRLVSETDTVQKRVSDYARELNISGNYLNRIIKKCAGISPLTYIHRRFIMSAKKMALETSLSMKEIAYRLGFEDTAHFSKFFKTNTGINFTDYKKSIVISSKELSFIKSDGEGKVTYC